ncbi:hypothetical protein BDY21DRAFT_348038 [Lineolata rhizophorae]|uniref:Uncharacterized protein n=1 Tax=Lineolata rhizophorae TaxID=578093 RepID=A0A6A6NX59_9PEZI|nr:hypothetical protein BDY21DRAFT_348038 [Lineolata rhizophorae]
MPIFHETFEAAEPRELDEKPSKDERRHPERKRTSRSASPEVARFDCRNSSDNSPWTGGIAAMDSRPSGVISREQLIERLKRENSPKNWAARRQQGPNVSAYPFRVLSDMLEISVLLQRPSWKCSGSAVLPGLYIHTCGRFHSDLQRITLAPL